MPLGIIAAALVIALLRNPEEPRKLAVDAPGLAFLALGVGSLQYVLDQGQRKDWFDDASITMFACLACVGLIAFVLWELHAEKPIVDLRVLRNPTVWAGSMLGMVLGISLYGSVLILPLYTQSSLGFTATLSGLLLVMRAGAVMLCTPPIAIMVQRGKADPRLLIASGFVMIGISNLMLASVTTTQSSFWTFFGSLALSGVGLSQIFVPLTSHGAYRRAAARGSGRRCVLQSFAAIGRKRCDRGVGDDSRAQHRFISRAIGFDHFPRVAGRRAVRAARGRLDGEDALRSRSTGERAGVGARLCGYRALYRIRVVIAYALGVRVASS